MERQYYSAESLSRTLPRFEERFGMPSEAFYEAHVTDDESVAHIPGFHRHVWASFYREAHESGKSQDFAERVGRTLELA